MSFKKVEKNGYILGIGEVDGKGNITKKEYVALQNLLRNKPTKEGFQFKLNAENLEWEEFEFSEELIFETDEATIEDYEEALQRMGVEVNDEG